MICRCHNELHAPELHPGRRISAVRVRDGRLIIGEIAQTLRTWRRAACRQQRSDTIKHTTVHIDSLSRCWLSYHLPRQVEATRFIHIHRRLFLRLFCVLGCTEEEAGFERCVYQSEGCFTASIGCCKRVRPQHASALLAPIPLQTIGLQNSTECVDAIMCRGPPADCARPAVVRGACACVRH